MNALKYFLTILLLLACGVVEAGGQISALDENCMPDTIASLNLRMRGKSFEKNWWIERLRDINNEERSRIETEQYLARLRAPDEQYARELAAVEARRTERAYANSGLSPQEIRADREAGRAMRAVIAEIEAESSAAPRRWFTKCRAYAGEQIRRLE